MKQLIAKSPIKKVRALLLKRTKKERVKKNKELRRGGIEYAEKE